MEIDSTPSVHDDETEEAELTPRPTKENQDQLLRIFDLSADDNNEHFQTPLALRRKKRTVKLVMESDPDEESDPDDEVESKEMEKEVMKRKRGQMEGGGKKETKGDGKKEVRVR